MLARKGASKSTSRRTFIARAGFPDLCDELVKEGRLGNDIARMGYMNKLARSALLAVRVGCCAIGRQGWEYLV